MNLLLRVLGLLFKLIVFAVTGEWPGSSDDEKPVSAPRPQPPRKPVAQGKVAAKRAINLDAVAQAQRTSPVIARMLNDVDRTLAELAEPLVSHASTEGVALEPRRFVAFVNLPAAQLNEAAEGTLLSPVSVEENFADTPERWVFLARHVGRTWLDAVPSLRAEIYRAQRLPQTLFVPPGHGAYDADTARAALGVWFPELFADAFATFVAGPGYASALAATLTRAKQPMDTVVARAQGRWLSAVPPSAIRMHVVLSVLERLGFHEWEQRLRARWQAAHDVPDSLYLPLSDGRLMAIPMAYMLEELDDILDTVLEEPQVALAQATWLDIPGFAYLHAEHARVERVAESLLRGEAVDAPARILIAAAALALDDSLRARLTVASALARSLHGADAVAVVKAASTNAQAGERLTLADAFRDRTVVRDALVLGSAFAPLKRRPFRF